MGEAELIKQCMRGVNAARKELYDTLCGTNVKHLLPGTQEVWT